MADNEDEERRLRSVALLNANAILGVRQRAEREIATQQERLRITLASIGDAVISTDAEGRVTFMNGVAEKLTGWSQDEAAGRPLPEIFNIVNSRTRLPAENPALRALHEGVVVGLANHTVLIARDGTERPIDDSAAPMRDEAGVAVGAVLVFRDVTERMRAQESQERLAAIVASSDDAIISKTLDGIVTSWNAGAERLFGYTAAEAVGMSITQIIPPERLSEEKAILERLVRAERIDHFETVRIAKDGRRLDISLTVSPLCDAEGRVVGASKVARDITARRQAEDEKQQLLKEVEAERKKLADVFQEAPSFMCVRRGPQHVFERANDRYFELLDRRDIIGKPLREAVPEAEGQGFLEVLDRVYRTGEPFFGVDVPISLRRGGRLEQRILEFVYQPIRDADGAVTGILAHGIDLTDRKQAEAELARVTAESERQRRLYETILSSTPDFVYVFSLDYRVLYANDALVAMWGLQGTTTIGKTFLDVGYEPWHAEMHCREIDQVRATKQPVRGEVPFNGTHGRRIYDYIFVPVLGADGEVEAVAGTTRDITDRKAMEDALRDADRKKDDFLALLAHELRNPLAPIRNGLQVLRLAEDRKVRERSQDMMDRQLGHMVRLIDDLLDVARISRSKMELRRGKVQLADVLNGAVETARPLIDAAGHHLEVSLPSEPILLDADLTRLAQVFSNLLTNSAKYTEPGGRIWLTAESGDGSITISVRDTGIGIPAAALPSIFDMFSQVDRSLERSMGGLGIGLALVKGLVEMHGGTVTAESDGAGRGSTFRVRLPALERAAEAAARDLSGDQRQAAPRRRILVVDDNRDSATSLAMLLQLRGDDVRTAHDGIEAVEAAEALRPDVILMDVGMPKLNGYEATRKIRERAWGKSTIIVALTGWGQHGDRAQSKEAGCDGHLVKPVSMPDLEGLLNELAIGAAGE